MNDIDRHTPNVVRFEPDAQAIQARNRQTLKNYWLQMVMEDRAESAPYPLWLVEAEGNA
jgi:hypothetical protein